MTATKKPISFSRKVLLYLIGVLAFLIFSHLVLQYLSLVLYQEQNAYLFELSNRMDFDDEKSVPTWASQALFLSIGLVSLLIRRYSTNKRERNAWLIIGIIGIIFSIDEVATIHETVLHLLHGALLEEGTTSAVSNAWLLVVPFMLIALGLVIRSIATALNRRTALLLGVGLLITVIGAVLIDILSVEFASGTFPRDGLMAALEESLELIGAIIMLYACVDYLERMKPDLFVRSNTSVRVAKK